MSIQRIGVTLYSDHSADSINPAFGSSSNQDHRPRSGGFIFPLESRRRGDRRKKDEAVILDTRSQYQRRTQLGRRQDEMARYCEAESPATGIDIYA